MVSEFYRAFHIVNLKISALWSKQKKIFYSYLFFIGKMLLYYNFNILMPYTITQIKKEKRNAPYSNNHLKTLEEII